MITDELRPFAADPYTGWVPTDKQQADLRAIADRIDEEHEKSIVDALLNDGLPMSDEVMAEHGWIRLPKDADGEYIHIGDVMCWLDEDVHNKVDYMHLCGDGWWVYAHGIGVRSKELRHYHAPTVEDVLREFAMRTDEIPNDASGIEPFKALVADFAKRLRLAEGEDA